MKNKKYIAVSVAIALGISACGDKTSQEYINQGQASLSEAKLGDAIVQFKNAVRVDPKNPAARTQLGLAYLEHGEYLNAEKELSKAIELGEVDESVVVSLAIARAKVDDTDGIQQLLTDFNSLNDDNYQAILFYAGVALSNNEQKEQGQDTLGQAVSIKSESGYGKLAKAYSYYLLAEHKQGLIITEKLLEEDAENKEALILHGHMLEATGMHKEASESFAKHSVLAPRDFGILFFEIKSLLNDEQFAKAEPKVDKLLSIYKEAPLAQQYKAQIAFEKKDYRSAISHADIAVKSGFSLPVARMVAGTSAFYESEFEQAYYYLKPLEDNLSSDNPLHKVLAVVKIKLGYTQEAVDGLELLSDFNETDIAFLQQSTDALIKAKDFKNAQAVIDKAKQVAPNNPYLELKRAELLLAQQDIGAIEAFEYALFLDSSLALVEQKLAVQYLRFDQDKKAQALAERWIAMDASRVTGYLLKGVISLKNSNTVEAENAYQEALKLDKENVTALYAIAVMRFNAKKYAESSDILKSVLSIEPSHAGAITYLSKTATKLNNVESVVSFLENVKETDASNVTLELGLAQNYRNQGLPEKAISLLESLDQSQGMPESYWTILGDAYIQVEQFDKAESTLNSGLAQYKMSYPINLRLIGMYDVKTEYSKALSTTKLMIAEYPRDMRFQILEALFELRTKNIVRAKELSNSLLERKVSHSLVDVVAGQLALIEKDYESSISHFNSAYERRITRMNAVNLARALKFSGEHNKAEKVLEDFLVQYDDARTRVLLSELYQSAEKKVEQLEKANKSSPGNVLILNNLAWQYYQLGKIDSALEYIEQAYQQDNKFAPVLETYGVVLSKSGDNEKAIGVLESAMNGGGTDLKARLILAKLKIDINDNAGARNVLDSIDTRDENILKEKVNLMNKLN